MPQISRVTLETNGKLPAILVYLLCVKPGFEEMVHDELLTLRRKSRLEAGCFHFDLYRLANSRFFCTRYGKMKDKGYVVFALPY